MPGVRDLTYLTLTQGRHLHMNRTFLVLAPFWPEGQLGLTMHMVLFQHSLTPRLIAWLPKHAKMEIVIPFKGGLGGQKEVSDWLLKAMFPATTGKCRERQLHSFQFPPTGYIM